VIFSPLKYCAVACVAVAATPAFADHSGGYVYWPGHFRGAYKILAPSSSRSDRNVDPVAIAAVIAQLASIPKEAGPRNEGSGDRDGSRSASRLCAAAAEDRFDGNARLHNIRTITQNGDRYTVRGTMMGDRAFYRFICDTQFGNVERVDFGSARSEAAEYGPP
jgi:hypothetical protein